VSRRSVAVAISCILAFYVVFQVRAFVPAYTEVDPDGYLVMAKRIAHGQSPALADDPFVYNTHVWVENAPGSVVPKFAPGYSVVLAFFYRLFGDEGMFYVSPVMGALALLGAFALFRLWLQPVAQVCALATLALNGAVLFYSGYVLPHATELCVVTWGMAGLWSWLREPRPVTGTAAGLLLGFACAIRHTDALLVVPVAWALFAARGGAPGDGIRRWAPWMALAAAYAVFPLGMLGYNAAVFGHPLVTGYALSDEQFPLAWQSLFTSSTEGRAPAFSWDALTANFSNLVHGLNYELFFMVFPLGLLGMLLVGEVRERVLRLAWWVPIFLVYAAYYFSPPNLAGYRFLVVLAPLFVGSGYLLLERVALGRASGLALLALVPAVVGLAGLPAIGRTLVHGPRPAARMVAMAARRATAALDHDAVILAWPPLHQHLGTRQKFLVYATPVFAADYGAQIEDESGGMQASRRDRLLAMYRTGDAALRALQQERIRTFLTRGRQVVFLAPPAEADDVQRLSVPDGYQLRRIDEWDAPAGGRWGLYAIVPTPAIGTPRR
jgi:hypothetical protein